MLKYSNNIRVLCSNYKTALKYAENRRIWFRSFADIAVESSDISAWITSHDNVYIIVSKWLTQLLIYCHCFYPGGASYARVLAVVVSVCASVSLCVCQTPVLCQNG